MEKAPRVVVISGHMVDTPDRPEPRFPPSEVPRVAAAIRGALDDWGVNESTTLVTSGARGADILGAEEARARGASVHLVLAKGLSEFEQESVALPESDWVGRLRSLVNDAHVEVIDLAAGENAFERANARIIEVVNSLGPDLRALVVWDGEGGDGPGGTTDFVRRLGLDPGDDRVRVIDPRPGRDARA